MTGGLMQDLKDPGHRETTWDVPYICQFDYPKKYTAWTGCGATSSAMLLNYYYPSQNCDLLDIWQSGVKQYNYHGPAVKYFNFAFAMNMEQDRVNTLKEIMPDYEKYFSGNYAAATWLSMKPYLEHVWGFCFRYIDNPQTVLEALREAPLLCLVYSSNGSIHHRRPRAGHYIVITGVDVNSGVLFINDPGRKNDINGNGRAVAMEPFFNNWFRKAFMLFPIDRDPAKRQHTIAVGNCHNDFQMRYHAMSSKHRMTVDKPDAKMPNGDYTWQYSYNGYRFFKNQGEPPDGELQYYGAEWFYPLEDGHDAEWRPALTAAGSYQVTMAFVGHPDGVSFTCSAQSKSGKTVATAIVDQKTDRESWKNVTLAESVYLEDGSCIRADNLPAGARLGAIKFAYLDRSV